MNRPVDVIVPVFEAADELERCLASVLGSTPGEHVGIVLADDGSRDPRVADLLDAAAAADPRVTVVRSPENRGFVRNCNEAMAGSVNDVVLLNSDTVVAPGWLDRLQAVAYVVDRVGSVTPWSDNATICSTPSWFEANRYPDRVTVDDLDQLAAATPVGLRELPTGVGFCLYLRRSALDEVGLFDEAAFGRGYGEENDLNARMRHNGFLNLLAPNVFVRHVGGASFAGSIRVEEQVRTVRRRWPAYSRSVAEIRRADPFRGDRHRFGAALAARFRDPTAIRPLYVLHYRVRIGRKGGTEHHLEDLIDGAGPALDPLVLTVEDGEPIAQWDADGAGTAFPARIGPADTGWVDRLLDLGVDLLHVQHPKRLPLENLEALHAGARRRGLPIVWTLHDYYSICPCVQLVHPDGSPCPTTRGVGCDPCDELSRDEAGLGLVEWTDRFARLVEQASAVLSPSMAAATIQAERLGIGLPTVVPHGSDMPSRSLPAAAGRTRPRLVVLGYNAPQKGSAIAAGLVAALPDVDWVFLGRKHLDGVEPSASVRFLGEYDRSELPARLEALTPDAVLLLSRWPETFLYTLTEAWRNGLPVFATDVGALGERVRATGAGVLFAPDDVTAAAATIAEALRDPARMASIRAAAVEAGMAEPSVAEMAVEYLGIYHRLVSDRRRTPTAIPPAPDQGEMDGWFGSFAVPFPSAEASPLRQ